MSLPHLSNQTARHLFLDRHALLESPSGPCSGGDLYDLIHRLGFVQLDSVNTLARAHDMILYARRPRYRPKALKRLYESDGRLFEHWTHDAAVIPRDFYPHWHMRFARDATLLKNRWREGRRENYEAQFETVLTHIRDYGPVCSAELGTDEKKGSGGWWDWHPSKTALEYLWRSGALTVTGRKGFQKQYDLTERVIETHLRDDRPDEGESIDWLCNAALDRLGFATSGEMSAFWDTVSAAEAKVWCAQQLAAGHLTEATVDCANGASRKVLVRPRTLDEGLEFEPPTQRMRVLSPFDPALRDRNRAERLFGFHYRIEIFVPAPKRKYGYYVFPLMEGDRLVGRVDMKADRPAELLRVTAVWPERNVHWSKTRQAKFEAELTRVAKFAGLSDVSFDDNWLRDPQ